MWQWHILSLDTDLLGRKSGGVRRTRATRLNQPEQVRTFPNVDIMIIISRDPAGHGPTMEDIFGCCSCFFCYRIEPSFFFLYFLPSFPPLLPPPFLKGATSLNKAKDSHKKGSSEMFSSDMFQRAVVNPDPHQKFGLMLLSRHVPTLL